MKKDNSRKLYPPIELIKLKKKSFIKTQQHLIFRLDNVSYYI